MTQLLHGLSIIPDVENDIFTVRNFVAYQTDRALQMKTIFNIETFIELINETIQKFGFYMVTDGTNTTLSILDQLQKLSTDNLKQLENAFGPIGLYRIACIIDYVSNTYNNNVLRKLHSIGLVGINRGNF